MGNSRQTLSSIVPPCVNKKMEGLKTTIENLKISDDAGALEENQEPKFIIATSDTTDITVGPGEARSSPLLVISFSSIEYSWVQHF